MTKKLRQPLVLMAWLIGFVVIHGCNVTRSPKTSDCCVATFRFAYESTIHDLNRKKDEKIYAGIINSHHDSLNGYEKFVFGSTKYSVICWVKKSEDALRYINSTDEGAGNENKVNSSENVLFYFNKEPGYKWQVNIDSSYFWRRDVTFIELDRSDSNDPIYVFRISPQEGVTDIGYQLTKLYYRRGKGIVKFVIKTHWFPVEVRKIENK